VKTPNTRCDLRATAACLNDHADGHQPFDEIALDNLPTSRGVSEREKVLALFVQRIAELPPEPKKVLAMRYHENMQLSEIAVRFDLAESRIRELHAQTVATLRNYFVTVLTQICRDSAQQFECGGDIQRSVW
jgi:DNA-directed RNA polymerase specialized sigma subunit